MQQRLDDVRYDNARDLRNEQNDEIEMGVQNDPEQELEQMFEENEQDDEIEMYGQNGEEQEFEHIFEEDFENYNYEDENIDPLNQLWLEEEVRIFLFFFCLLFFICLCFNSIKGQHQMTSYLWIS